MDSVYSVRAFPPFIHMEKLLNKFTHMDECHGDVEVTKSIGFRPSLKAIERIKETMKEKGINRNRAINLLIEQKPQLEQALQKTTGQLINCPLRPFQIPLYSTEITYHSPVDSSVCRSCSRYPCGSWENIESHERLGL